MALMVGFYFQRLDIIGLTLKIVFNDKVIGDFVYMLVVLIVGLTLLVKYADRFHKCTLRKLFHILAFVMFTPTLLKINQSRKHQ